MTTREQTIIKRASKVFTTALHFYYPVAIARGEGIYVVSTEGRRYMDFSSGIAVLNIGHNHPKVMEAVRAQLDQFVHTGGVYYNETTVRSAERLLSVAPAGLDMLFFSNSGAEAVEGALKLARYSTGRQGIIAFTDAFHGRTLGAISLTTSSAKYRNRYHPLLPSVYHAPYPYCFRCQFNCKSGSCELWCLEQLRGILKRQIFPEEVAAIIIEPVQGEGGYIPAPIHFLQGLRKLCTENGIMLIFDEVQSGMGRTGEWFAAGRYGVTPDIMAIAKGIASGFPLSAVAAGREIMGKWLPGAHGTTFGGNPVSCAAAIATIDAIEEEGLLESSSRISVPARERLARISRSYPVVGDVRGSGFMIGIEFVTETGAPNRGACEKVVEFCLERGLILIGCGLERNIIRFIPPLIATEEEIQGALDIFEDGVKGLR